MAGPFRFFRLLVQLFIFPEVFWIEIDFGGYLDSFFIGRMVSADQLAYSPLLYKRRRHRLWTGPRQSLHFTTLHFPGDPNMEILPG